MKQLSANVSAAFVDKHMLTEKAAGQSGRTGLPLHSKVQAGRKIEEILQMNGGKGSERCWRVAFNSRRGVQRKALRAVLWQRCEVRIKQQQHVLGLF